MAIYRLDLDRPALVKLLGGTTLLGTLLFFSGTLVGYSASPEAARDVGDDVPTGSEAALPGDPPSGAGFASSAVERVCPVEPAGASTRSAAVTIAEAPHAIGGDAGALPDRWSALDQLARDTRPASLGPGTEDATVLAGTSAAVDEILAPRMAGAESAGAQSAFAAGRYAVQVGAFSVRGNADALAARLRARGYDPLIVTARNRSGQWLEYVHLSVHPQERAAQMVAGEFTLKEQLPAIVIAVADEGERLR